MQCIRLLVACSFSANALFACGNDPARPGSAVADASAGNTSAGGGAAGSAGAAAGSGLAGGTVAGTGPNLDVDPDAGTIDQDADTACSHLNIGILGNPGARASSNFQDWLVKSGTSATRIHTNSNEPLTSASLEPFDVVILDWLTHAYTADEAAIFAAWVSAGGGMASMTGYSNTPADWHANSLLAPLRVAYGGSLASGPITRFATHPVTAGLSSVTFLGGYPVADLGGSTSTRTPIAFLPDTSNTVAAVAIEMGKGRGIVWGDEWIEFDSEWSTLPEITQFWVQLFAWIAPKNKCELTPPK